MALDLAIPRKPCKLYPLGCNLCVDQLGKTWADGHSAFESASQAGEEDLAKGDDSLRESETTAAGALRATRKTSGDLLALARRFGLPVEINLQGSLRRLKDDCAVLAVVHVAQHFAGDRWR